MRFPRLTALGVAGALVLSLGACSKKDETTSTAASSTTTTAKSTTTEKSGGDDSTETTKKGSGDSMPNLGNLDECLNVSMAYLGLLAKPLQFMGGASKEDIEKFQQEVKDLDAQIPDEIKDDFNTVASAWNDFAKTMEGASGNIMDPEFQKQIEDASAKLDSPEVKEAQANIDAYFEKTCSGN